MGLRAVERVPALWRSTAVNEEVPGGSAALRAEVAEEGANVAVRLERLDLSEGCLVQYQLVEIGKALHGQLAHVVEGAWCQRVGIKRNKTLKLGQVY